MAFSSALFRPSGAFAAALAWPPIANTGISELIGNIMRSRKGFTLVELLVVIAIIAMLIAIFLPICIKVRRRALVLVCPIAYVGEDGGVYLTDPKGYHSLQISESSTLVSPNHNIWAPLAWSPSGRRLAYNCVNRLSHFGGVTIQEPSSGRSWQMQGMLFSGWIDSESFLATDRNIYRVDDANQAVRAPVDSVNLSEGEPYYPTVAPTPLGADFPYVASFLESDGSTHIGWVRKNYHPGRILWKSKDMLNYVSLFPKIDPFNEYVACQGSARTLVKSLKEDRGVPPLEVYGEFCDWTDDGNLLTLTGYSLKIYTKDNKLLRTLSPPVRPALHYWAAYRKYGRQ
jgi:prepilin-type N-terminal cleavage/methylation domain-containing protein